MPFQFISAGFSHGLELMVFDSAAETATGRGKGVVEQIIGVIHLIDPEYGFETSFVKTGVMRNQRKTFDPGCNLPPYLRENRCPVGILRPESVDTPAEPAIILGLGLDEAVEGIHYFATAHHHYADAADAAGLLVRRFEIYCSEVVHPIMQVPRSKAVTALPFVVMDVVGIPLVLGVGVLGGNADRNDCKRSHVGGQTEICADTLHAFLIGVA